MTTTSSSSPGIALRAACSRLLHAEFPLLLGVSSVAFPPYTPAFPLLLSLGAKLWPRPRGGPGPRGGGGEERDRALPRCRRVAAARGRAAPPASSRRARRGEVLGRRAGTSAGSVGLCFRLPPQKRPVTGSSVLRLAPAKGNFFLFKVFVFLTKPIFKLFLFNALGSVAWCSGTHAAPWQSGCSAVRLGAACPPPTPQCRGSAAPMSASSQAGPVSLFTLVMSTPVEKPRSGWHG